LQRLSLRLIGFSKRLFFLQVQGFLQKKILLRSEYGVIIGETAFTDKPSSGQLTINGQKFFHRVEEEKLVLLNSENMVVGTSQIMPKAFTNRYEFYSLLFGFAWFLTADRAANENPITATA
jgi:hypothetical protein